MICYLKDNLNSINFAQFAHFNFNFPQFKVSLPRCDWYGSRVEVVADGVLEVVINTSLWKSVSVDWYFRLLYVLNSLIKRM